MVENARFDVTKPSCDFVFYTGFAFLASHELDAVAQAEWKLLPILNTLADETAYVAFVAAHIPLFAVLLWLVGHRTEWLRSRARLAVDLFLIAHAGLHLLMSGHSLYSFHGVLSQVLIFGGGIVGLVHVALVRRHAGNRPC